MASRPTVQGCAAESFCEEGQYITREMTYLEGVNSTAQSDNFHFYGWGPNKSNVCAKQKKRNYGHAGLRMQLWVKSTHDARVRKYVEECGEL